MTLEQWIKLRDSQEWPPHTLKAIEEKIRELKELLAR